jgi:DtxR family Mn-dependent transcriptional regulator
VQANDPPLSDAIQDYLREVFKLESAGKPATTSSVGAAMGVSAPSASSMLKRLAALGLVEHRAYRGVALTVAGRRVALEIIRHHRLLEQYLATTLGFPLEGVHAEADRLEHSLSAELERRIDAALGHPTHDPHGHPIPDARLNLAEQQTRTLLDLRPGEEGTVSVVPDANDDLLRYLASLDLVPGRTVAVLSVAPFDGPLILRTDTGEHPIAHALAATIGIGD